MFNNNIKNKNQQGSDKPSDEKDNEILVEFTTDGGLRPVGLFSRKKQPELAEKSNEAVNKAMNTIKNMATRVHSTVQTIENRPKNVEVEFGNSETYSELPMPYKPTFDSKGNITTPV